MVAVALQKRAGEEAHDGQSTNRLRQGFGGQRNSSQERGSIPRELFRNQHTGTAAGSNQSEGAEISPSRERLRPSPEREG